MSSSSTTILALSLLLDATLHDMASVVNAPNSKFANWDGNQFLGNMFTAGSINFGSAFSFIPLLPAWSDYFSLFKPWKRTSKKRGCSQSYRM